SENDWINHLLDRLHAVQDRLRLDPTEDDPRARFADVLDSMGMVEFIALVTADCSVKPEVIERVAGRSFGTVAELATALRAGGLVPRQEAVAKPSSSLRQKEVSGWLLSTAMNLPDTVQPAGPINEALQRPRGWLEEHAGILQRRLWGEQDPLAAAADAGKQCLERVGVAARDVDALLVTSEAPPFPIGLGAA